MDVSGLLHTHARASFVSGKKVSPVRLESEAGGPGAAVDVLVHR
jgi:hypothetical protein